MCRMQRSDDRSDDANSIKCSKRSDGRRTWGILEPGFGFKEAEHWKRLKEQWFRMRAPGPSVSKALPNPPGSHQGQKPPENAWILAFSVSLTQERSFWGPSYLGLGARGQRGEASATPGSPPDLLFDFNLTLDFFFFLILHYRRLF